MPEIHAQSQKNTLKGLLVIFGILLLIGAILSLTTRDLKNSLAKYEAVTTITCTPDETLWDRTGGWCMSEELPAGTYKISFQSSTLVIPLWKNGKIAEYHPVPPQGIGLSYWKGKPFEKRFIQEASLGELPMVGAPIARIGHGKAFNPVGTFDLIEPSIIGISINKIPRRKFFEGVTGELVMKIERQL